MSDAPVDSVKPVPPRDEAPSSAEEGPRSAEEAAATPEAKEPPDPVWGLGVGITGLVVMATGGAGTWHWVFNVGEFIMLVGAAMFLGAATSTSLRQRPLRLRERWAAWRARRTGAAD
ncbi:MAG: hypothetical protein VB934_12225 [Polyangiaceae bacterium]